MKHMWIIFVGSLLSLNTLSVVLAPAAEANGYGPCSGWFSNVRPSMDPALVNHRVEKTIECATHIWPISGGPFKAIEIGHRESGYPYMSPWAYNPSGCAGIFQHMVKYWLGRVHDYIHRDWYSKWRWSNGISAFDMRANVLVAIQMIHRYGWGPWT